MMRARWRAHRAPRRRGAHGSPAAGSFVSPRGLVSYVERIAEAGAGLPLMLYLRNDGIGLDAIEKALPEFPASRA
jgi:hypothetical protein